MSHPRKLIRDKVYTQLLSATNAGENVFKTRVLPYRHDMELPAIAVYTMDETVDPESRSTAPREIERALEVVVEGLVAVVQDPDSGMYTDDQMDELAEQIEKVMHKDPYFGGEAGDSVLASTEMEILEDGDRLLGMVKQTYSFTYRTLAPEAPTDLVDFERVEAKHRPVGVGEAEQAKDIFTVEAP